MLTRREKLLIRPWQQRRYNNHRRKVQSALPAIDVGPPPIRGHVCCKLKKQQSEHERATRIERDNCRLLQRMGAITHTNRIDNHWITPPPSFLQRVGIYYEPELSVSVSEDDIPPVKSSDAPSSRKSRCLACNPQRIKQTKPVPEERICWETKHRTSCVHSSSTTVTQTITSSGTQVSKSNEAEDIAPQRLTLTREGLHLAVTFPSNATIRLKDGKFDRLLQREYCECKAFKSLKHK